MDAAADAPAVLPERQHKSESSFNSDRDKGPPLSSDATAAATVVASVVIAVPSSWPSVQSTRCKMRETVRTNRWEESSSLAAAAAAADNSIFFSSCTRGGGGGECDCEKGSFL